MGRDGIKPGQPHCAYTCPKLSSFMSFGQSRTEVDMETLETPNLACQTVVVVVVVTLVTRDSSGDSPAQVSDLHLLLILCLTV